MCTSTRVHVCTHTHIHSRVYVQYAHSCSHFLFFGLFLAIPRTSQVALNDSTTLTRSLNCSTEGLSSGCPHLNTFSFFKDMLLNPISDAAIFTRFPSLLNQPHFFSLCFFSPHLLLLKFSSSEKNQALDSLPNTGSANPCLHRGSQSSLPISVTSFRATSQASSPLWRLLFSW